MNIKSLNLVPLLVFLFFSCFSLTSCIDAYDVDFSKSNQVLVVEGFLTDDALSPDTIKIQYSNYQNGLLITVPVVSAKATVVNLTSGQEIKLIEYGTGRFLPPQDFKAKTNEKYLLKFSLPNGQQYESSPETLTLTPPILNVYEKFNTKSRVSDNGKDALSASEVFVDFQDIPNQKNYYLWRYIDYEKLQHCTTCQNTMFDYAKQSCVLKTNNLREAYYDYGCEGDCYAIVKGTQVNVLSDIVSDGALISGRLVAKVPYYYLTGFLVEVQQMSISPETYAFYRILESQSQNTGGLADTPPAAIVGNIKNTTTPTEKVVGYFAVTNIQKKRLWIDRSDASGTFEYILGHKIIEEPQNQPFRPPLARCRQSATRTPIKPIGWL
ncbi:MAG: DUF4249 domain-containing protein [Bacteroidota bacterium]|jgi:hypothetical protein